MIRYRRLAALLLGVWLGASIIADAAVAWNFETIDRFLSAPGSAAAAEQLNAIGRAPARVILRRNAGEENNWIFLNWERLEFALGGGLLLLLLFGERPRKITLALSLVMLAIVLAEHFVLTPTITSLGRVVDELGATDPQYKRFWLLHGLYSGLDISKMLAGFGLAACLTVQPRERAAALNEGTLKQGTLIRG